MAEARCVECGRVAERDSVGWRAYIVDDPDDEEEPEVAIFCPDCAAREFGPPGISDVA